MARLFALLILALPGWAATAAAEGADPASIRIGVLAFGTVSWELQVIRDQGLAKEEGVELEVIPLAAKTATDVALQGGAVDVIVTDWIWVSRQRAEGRHYTFVPFSLAVGSVMVRPDAGVKTLADLRGKRLGVAGGPLDKGWLLLRAYARKTLGVDLADLVEPSFAAPPMLNELIRRGELPAVLNFWHYGARLKAAGMRELIGIAEVLPALGVQGDVPLLGWVFDETWADAHRTALEGLLRASRRAKRIMAESDAVWDTLRPLTGAEDEATLIALREGYRAGIPRRFGAREIASAQRVFEILAEQGGEALAGKGRTLSPGTFWHGYTF